MPIGHFFFFCKKETKRSFVYDQHGLLKTSEIIELDSVLHKYENDTDAEIAVFIASEVPLKYNDTFEYSLLLSNQLKVGKEGKNNGILLFLSMKEKTLEIRLGYGMEWHFKQEELDTIKNKMFTFFRGNEFYKGIHSGVAALINKTEDINWLLCNSNKQMNCLEKSKVEKVEYGGHNFLLLNIEGRLMKIHTTMYMDNISELILNGKTQYIYYWRTAKDQGNLTGVSAARSIENF